MRERLRHQVPKWVWMEHIAPEELEVGTEVWYFIRRGDRIGEDAHGPFVVESFHGFQDRMVRLRNTNGVSLRLNADKLYFVREEQPT